MRSGDSASARGGELLRGGAAGGEEEGQLSCTSAASGGSELCVKNLGLPNSVSRGGDFVVSRCRAAIPHSRGGVS